MRVMVGACVIAMATGVLAKDRPADVPATVLDELLACSALTDPKERLTCYDTKAAAVQAARSKKELIVSTKEEVRKTNEGLFGYSVPKSRVLEGVDVESINAKITAVRKNAKGWYVITLENAGRWEQVDGQEILEPRPGQMIDIRKAAMGSFLAKIGKGRTFRVRRLNE
jgi:hypothetical protein